MNQGPTSKTRVTLGTGIRWNQGSNWRKLEVWWSSRGLIDQIREQGSTYKRRSKLGLTIESGMDTIAWNYKVKGKLLVKSNKIGRIEIKL